MPNQLSQKERMLLQDQMNHEEICIKKYTNYSNIAQDPELKQMFKTYASQEQQHYNTLNQILNSQTPNMSAQQGGQTTTQGGNMTQTSLSGTMANQNDADLCTDMLMTEKYVSSAYNTAIFEFADANTRQALNHIQKEEQGHGEGIFKYMQNKGMYKVQQ